MTNRHHARVLGELSARAGDPHDGYGYDPALSEGSIKAPIFQSSTSVFRSAEDGKRFFEVAFSLSEKIRRRC